MNHFLACNYSTSKTGIKHRVNNGANTIYGKKKGRAVNPAFSCSVEPSPKLSVESSESEMVNGM